MKQLDQILFRKSGLIAVITILLLFAFIITSLLSFNVTRQSITYHTKNQILPLVSDNIYSEIQQDLITPIHNSSLMANDEFLIDWVHSGEKDLDEIVRYLRRIKESYGYSSSFYISDITKNYYYYDGILKQVSPDDAHDVWYYRFVESGKIYDLDVDTDEATAGTITIFINHRLEDRDGNFLGVTGVGLEMVSVGQTLARYQERYGYLIYMIDTEGLIQIHPDQTLVEKVNIKNMVGISNLSEEILANREGTKVYEYHDKQGRKVLSARYFPDLEWYLIVQQDMNTSLNQARYYLYGNIAIGIGVTALVTLLVTSMINIFHARMKALAETDDLTNIYNRRKFLEHFQREIAYTKRYGHPLSLLMLDIDHFKTLNDTYGHLTGDEYLKRLAATLRKQIREIDTIARWGGEEFVILLHKTDIQQATIIAERLRQEISTLTIPGEKGEISRTISIGIASNIGGEIDIDELIRKADRAMYRAKQEGRNRICVAD